MTFKFTNGFKVVYSDFLVLRLVVFISMTLSAAPFILGVQGDMWPHLPTFRQLRNAFTSIDPITPYFYYVFFLLSNPNNKSFSILSNFVTFTVTVANDLRIAYLPIVDAWFTDSEQNEWHATRILHSNQHTFRKKKTCHENCDKSSFWSFT